MNVTIMAMSGRFLIVLGVILIALGLHLDRLALKQQIVLSRRVYRRMNYSPTRPEVIRLGLAILFNSLRFGLVGV